MGKRFRSRSIAASRLPLTAAKKSSLPRANACFVQALRVIVCHKVPNPNFKPRPFKVSASGCQAEAESHHRRCIGNDQIAQGPGLDPLPALNGPLQLLQAVGGLRLLRLLPVVRQQLADPLHLRLGARPLGLCNPHCVEARMAGWLANGHSPHEGAKPVKARHTVREQIFF